MSPVATLSPPPGGPLTTQQQAPGPSPVTPGLADLARRARAGGGEAFGLLYDQLAPGVLRFLGGLRLGLDPAALDDALQEAFLRLLRRLPGMADLARLRGYLFGIAHHVAVDLSRTRPLEPLDDEAPGDGRDPAGQAEGAERDRLVHRALAALPADARRALALRHAAGLTMQEVADALECSVPTARARLNEAASRLAIELRRRGVDPRPGPGERRGGDMERQREDGQREDGKVRS